MSDIYNLQCSQFSTEAKTRGVEWSQVSKKLHNHINENSMTNITLSYYRYLMYKTSFYTCAVTKTLKTVIDSK